MKLEQFVDIDSDRFATTPKIQQKGEQMKRAIFFISAIIIISSFSSQLLALPEGAVARLGMNGVSKSIYPSCAVTFSPDGKMLAVAGSIGIYLYDGIVDTLDLNIVIQHLGESYK